MVMCVRCEDVDLSDHISYETLERLLLEEKEKPNGFTLKNNLHRLCCVLFQSSRCV